MGNPIKKIWDVTSTVLVIVVVLCALLPVGFRLLGYRTFSVLSGSMEPEYSEGDLLYVKKVDVTTLAVGDPVTFVLNEDLVVATHRIIQIDPENQKLYTQGDANDIPDSDPVHFKNILGVPQFAIPKLGYAVHFMQNPPGLYITVGVGIALILLVFLPDLLRKKPEATPLSENTSKETE